MSSYNSNNYLPESLNMICVTHYSANAGNS